MSVRNQWAERVAQQHRGFHEPDHIRNWPLPKGGQFSPSKQDLCPDLFDANAKMHPWIRETFIHILDEFWTPRYGEWKSWTRIYLAGSLASFWWGVLDVDTLIGIDSDLFIKTHPKFDGFTDVEICTMLTHEFQHELNPSLVGFQFPPGDSGIPFVPEDFTFFANPRSFDIRAIKPYSAYNISSDTWAVAPSHMGKSWNAKMLSWGFWIQMADLGDEIQSLASINDVEARQAKAQAIYERVHTQRSEAFGPFGMGIADPRALQWVTLQRWGLLHDLELASHPERVPGHGAIPRALA